jgi:hypothetical protein
VWEKGVRDLHGGVFGAPKLLRHGWSVDVRHGALLDMFNSVFKLQICAITVQVGVEKWQSPVASPACYLLCY